MTSYNSGDYSGKEEERVTANRGHSQEEETEAWRETRRVSNAGGITKKDYKQAFDKLKLIYILASKKGAADLALLAAEIAQLLGMFGDETPG